MSLPRKPAGRNRRGATRRHSTSSKGTGDHWLNRLLDILVLSAVVVGSAALLVSLL